MPASSYRSAMLLLMAAVVGLTRLANAQHFYAHPAQQQPMPGRAQRSLYGGGGGWIGGGGIGIGGWGGPNIAVAPIGQDHITKEELIALLAAWKEVEAKPAEAPKPTPAPAPEPEPEPEPEEEDEQPEQEAQPEPEAPASPPPNVPLTVSLPAFVPIQLSAMYTAPAPLGIGAGMGAGLGSVAVAGAGAGAVEAAEAEHESRLRFGKNPRARLAKPAARSGAKSAGIRFPIANPRSFASANYVAPKPRFYRTLAAQASTPMRAIEALPPPSFLASAHGPLQLVPSSQLLSNWH